MAECVNALKQWTGLSRATVIFDSTVDEFTDDGIFNKTKGKKNVAVIGFTTEGDVFGAFYSRAVTQQDVLFYDSDIFAFSFESHGRCMTPQRFVLREEFKRDVLVQFCKNHWSGFFCFGYGHVGGGSFWLGDERSYCYCFNLSRVFEGIQDTTLTGKNGGCRKGPYLHCTRLVAIQFE